jgi:hypothetical protein
MVRPLPAQAPLETVGAVEITDELVPATGASLRFPNNHKQCCSPLLRISVSENG